MLCVLFCFIVSALCACPSEQGTRVSALGAITSLTVPAGSVYVYDLTSSASLTGVSVYGTLVFSNTKSLSITSKQITVFGGGKLVAGSCDCPFKFNLVFELTGTNPTEGGNPNGVGTKGIGVLDGGVLELYGEVRGPTWTQLSQTAVPGSKTLVLAEPVSWRAGDKLVLATTDYWENQNEELEIASVSGSTVTLTTALANTHYGEIYKGVDMRAEVGLLTRNILVTGDASSDSNSIGAHMMFLRGSTVRLSGVEVTKAGQLAQMGRYPIHFHVGKEMAPGQAVVADCSVHHCYQRCVTIHDTNNVEIRRNVCYKTKGHAYFLEVATEQKNIFAHNLGISPEKATYRAAVPPVPPLPSDEKPAVFWITNPANTFVHNHAVGGSFGFWYALPHWDLINPSRNPDMSKKDIIPRRTPIDKFSHNTAHSASDDCFHLDNAPNPENDEKTGTSNVDIVRNGVNLGRIGQNYDPQSDPFISALENPSRKTNNKNVYVNFEDSTFYKCANHGAWLRTLRTNFTGLYVSDCKRGLTSATGDTTTITNAVFVGFSPNKPALNLAEPWTTEWSNTQNKMVPSGWAPRGFEFYDGPNLLIDVRLFNFKHPVHFASGLGVLDHDVFGIGYGDESNPDQKGNWLRRVSIDDATTPLFAFPWESTVPLEDGEKEIFVWDRDGHLTGRPPANGIMATFIADEPFFRLPGCVGQDSRTRAIICPSTFFRSALSISGSLNDWSQPAVKLFRADDPSKNVSYCGTGSSCADTKKNSAQQRNFGVILHERNDQFIHFEHVTPSKIDMYFMAQKATETPVFGICLPAGASVSINGFKSTTSRAALDAEPYSADWNKFGAYWLDSSSGYLYVRVFFRNGWLPLNIVLSGGSGKGNWCTPRAAVRREIRSVPPLAPPAPLPALSNSISPIIPRNSGSVCSAPNPVTPPASVNCVFTETRSACTGQCGTQGTLTITRTITTPASGSGTPCPPTSGTETCTMPACTVTPVDCAVGQWSGWSDCANGPCAGAGSRSRSRTVIVQRQGTGAACPALTESGACTMPACTVTPVDCAVGQWSGWSDCANGPCAGSGSRSRSRTVIVQRQGTGAACPTLTDSNTCTMPACPVNGVSRFVVFQGLPTETSVSVTAVSASELKFDVVAKHTGMVAIGFPAVSGLMINSDAVIGWAGSSTRIDDYRIGSQRSSVCNGGSGICLDTEIGGTSDISPASASETNGITTLSFRKKIVATSPTDSTLASPGQPQFINIALGSSDAVSYHGETKTSTSFIVPTFVPAPVPTVTPAPVPTVPTVTPAPVPTVPTVTPAPVPTVNDIIESSWEIPTTVPARGAFLSYIRYSAIEPIYIEMHIHDASWNWFGMGYAVITSAGFGRARVSVRVENPIPAGVIVFVTANLKTLSAQLQNQNSPALKSFRKSVTPSTQIKSTFAATTPAATATLKFAKYPAVIPAGPGVIEVTVQYTAIKNSYISTNIQLQGGSWDWYTGITEIVPAGSGTLTVRMLTKAGIPVQPTAGKVGINTYMVNEDTYLSKPDPWANSESSVWVDVVASNSVSSVRATEVESKSFNPTQSTTQSGPAPQLLVGWQITLIAVGCVGLVVILLVVVVTARRRLHIEDRV